MFISSYANNNYSNYTNTLSIKYVSIHFAFTSVPEHPKQTLPVLILQPAAHYVSCREMKHSLAFAGVGYPGTGYVAPLPLPAPLTTSAT